MATALATLRSIDGAPISVTGLETAARFAPQVMRGTEGAPQWRSQANVGSDEEALSFYVQHLHLFGGLFTTVAGLSGDTEIQGAIQEYVLPNAN